MKVYKQINEDVSRQTGRLFPEVDEDDSRIAYHGTSLYFAPSIEANGLVSKFLPYSVKELDQVADNVRSMDNRLATSIHEYVQNGGTRLSFATTSWNAAKHAISFKGGQIARSLREARELGVVLPTSIQTILQEMEPSAPCVYAVDLSGVAEDEISLEWGRAFYVSGVIPIEKLVARFDLPIVINAPLKPLDLNRPGTLVNKLGRKDFMVQKIDLNIPEQS